jgi:hypothetical protein
MDPTHRLDPQSDDFVPPVRQQPQRLDVLVGADLRQIIAVEGRHGDGMGVRVVGLAAIPTGIDPHQGRPPGRDIDHPLALGHQPLG